MIKMINKSLENRSKTVYDKSGDVYMVTINDIALALKMSTATVSNALTGKGRVSEANRQAIIAKANEMGYDFGRLRMTPQRKVVAVFTESLGVTFCTRIAEGINRAAEYAGYRTVLYNLDLLYEDHDYNPPRERVRERMEEVLRHVESGIIGAVYVSQYPRDVTGVMPVVPFPVVYAYCYTNDGAPSVNTNDQQGAYIAVQELISRRKKRIAMISGPINSIPMMKRLSGYQRALIDAGLPVDLRMVVTGDWDIERSCERMQKLLQLDPPPDGVFCQSDHIALGVCRAIRQAGLSIPGDIAVVGFDNYDFASFVSPSLSTIDQPLEKIGRVAFDRLKKTVDREETETRSVLLDARLIRREST